MSGGWDFLAGCGQAGPDRGSYGRLGGAGRCGGGARLRVELAGEASAGQEWRAPKGLHAAQGPCEQ